MDGFREMLDAVRVKGLAAGRFRGLLQIVIGRRVTKADGTVISSGLTWRELAPILKELRFDRELVRDLGTDPDKLAPRDRERFWYSAIALARVDSPDATAEAESLIPDLKKLGYLVGPNPALIAKPTATKSADKPGKGKKK